MEKGNKIMTSRERVIETFKHGNPDRVPIDYHANPGIDYRLKKYFGLDKNDGEGLRKALGVDFKGVSPVYKGPVLHPPIKDRRVDPQWGWVTRYVEHATGSYWDYCDFPLQNADLDQVEKWPMPSVEDYDFSHIKEFCKKNRDFALYVGNAGVGDCVNTVSFWTGYTEALIGFATEDPAILRLIDRRHEIQYELVKRTLEEAEGMITFLWLGEDLGAQDRPLYGIDMFRKHIRPRLQRFVDLAKEFGVYTMIHSCGSSSWAFPDFIEMEIDAVDTLQPEALNMSPEYLVRNFGEQLSFHGCISTAGPVATGTPEEVIADCTRILNVMMKTRGYFFSPTHSLQDNSPVENVIAMYQTAHEKGRYDREEGE
ncbi:MAG: uroporphyrinogen decarboxylase family protein [Clostridia bacterium]|jgi:uroporphyrinogen decarboxylase|nr:hypothetical protein [Clostridiaceae bacterium]